MFSKCHVNDVQVSRGPQFGWFYFLPYSQNVSLVSFDSFDVLTALIAFALFNQSNHLAILKRIIVIGKLSVFYKSVEQAEEAARALKK